MIALLSPARRHVLKNAACARAAVAPEDGLTGERSFAGAVRRARAARVRVRRAVRRDNSIGSLRRWFERQKQLQGKILYQFVARLLRRLP